VLILVNKDLPYIVGLLTNMIAYDLFYSFNVNFAVSAILGSGTSNIATKNRPSRLKTADL